jgi:hypothetical protein
MGKKLLILLGLFIILFIGVKIEIHKQTTTNITIKQVKLTKIEDTSNDSYKNITFKSDKGKVYHLVIHDVYIEKSLVSVGYYYNVTYKKHEFERPDNFIQDID